MPERSDGTPITVRWSPTSRSVSPVGKNTFSPRATEVTRRPGVGRAWRSVLPATGRIRRDGHLRRAGGDPQIAHPFRTRDQLLAIGAHHVGDRQRADDPAFVVKDGNPRLR